MRKDDLHAGPGLGTSGRPAGISPDYYKLYAPVFARSAPMRAIGEMIEGMADTTAGVLLTGETGVGKEVVARALHAASPRHDRPWIKVNCAALPGELLESELFGHEQGAFTGAFRRKLGTFEFANQGTIFLDEMGELPLPLQPKLLHVLQDFEFWRIGGHEPITVDTRVIAATNRNLEALVASQRFREDLYYRLNVIALHIPPLRERREEIRPLAQHFLALFNEEYGRGVSLSAELEDLFLQYSWPGNVRELENVVRRLVVLGDVPTLTTELCERLHAVTVGQRPTPPPAGRPTGTRADQRGLREIRRDAVMAAEARVLREVLQGVRWNRTEAAKILQVSYKTLLKKIADCGLHDVRTRQERGQGDDSPDRGRRDLGQ
jgi:two-component system, NtrC family, response regulator AtoC